MIRATTEIPPMDLDAEHAILGSVLQPDAAGVMDLLATRLGRDDFFTDAHRTIFAAMLALHQRGAPVDHVTLAAALRDRGEFDSVGGAPKLAQLLEAGLLAIPVNVPSYIDQVLTASTKRELLQVGRQLSQAATNGAKPADVVETLEHDVARLRGRIGRRSRALVSAAEFASAPPAEPAWLIDQLILAASNGWIGAGPKGSKSYLALDLLLALAHGLAWLDHFAVLRPHVVVLVQEEDSRWRVYQRLERLCRGRAVGFPATLHVAVRTGIQLDEPASLEPFLRELAAVRPDLVVWDVFNRLHTKNERYPEQTLPILRRVDRIRDTLGCANLIAHHSRKPGTHGPDLASGGQKLRGPSEFWGWAENSLYLTPLKGKGRREEPRQDPRRLRRRRPRQAGDRRPHGPERPRGRALPSGAREGRRRRLLQGARAHGTEALPGADRAGRAGRCRRCRERSAVLMSHRSPSSATLKVGERSDMAALPVAASSYVASGCLHQLIDRSPAPSTVRLLATSRHHPERGGGRSGERSGDGVQASGRGGSEGAP